MPGRILEEVWFLVGYNFEQPMLNSQAIITYQCWYCLVLVHVQVLALSQAFERQLDQLSNITGYLRLSSLTGQIHPAVKKITKAGVQLSTIWRKEASSQSEGTFPLAKCSGATAGDRFGRPTKSPNWPDYRPIESPTA